jgi:hypothetical protein
MGGRRFGVFITLGFKVLGQKNKLRAVMAALHFDSVYSFHS